MWRFVLTALRSLLAEPPFRLATRIVLRAIPGAVRAKAHWDGAERPQYLFGVLYAADEAKRQGHSAVSAIEFGVAGGVGLLTLQRHADAVERLTGVRVHVYGFDSGRGLPTGTGDYRDHPDQWQAGDYPMNVRDLRAKLNERTTLVLGDIRETVMAQPIHEPLGFISVDLDYYSSTSEALKILNRSSLSRLHRVALYCDDVRMHWNHRFAGELLAIDEYNRTSSRIKIDQWRGLRAWRPFPDAPWIEGMYLAHDLEAITHQPRHRPAATL